MSDLTPAQQLLPLLAALDRAFRADFKRHGGLPADVTLAQFQVVTLLADAPRRSQTQIAQHLGVTGPTVVRIVDALEEKGLVVRTREGTDRRVVWVTLTEQGATLQQACARWHEERLGQVLGRLPARTTTQLLCTLTAFVAAADGGVEQSPRQNSLTAAG